jgi:hypothetical protein
MIDPYHGGRNEVTRTAAQTIVTRLKTWDGSVSTELDADGTYRVYVGEKHNPTNLVATNLVATGNVVDRERWYAND